MSDVPEHLWCVELDQEYLASSRSGELKTWFSLPLWYTLHDEPDRQVQVGTTQEELIFLLGQHGEYLRSQAENGNVESVVRFWNHVALWDEKPWSHLGISPQETKAWVEAWAAQLFADLDDAHAESAAKILLIPGYCDQDWNGILGSGASQRLAEFAIMWARNAYAHMLRDDLDPAEVIDRFGMALIEFVIIRYRYEITYEKSSLEPIYPHLGFTCDEACRRYIYLLRLKRQ